MSTNMPEGRKQSLEWLEEIIAQWTTNDINIGLTSAQVTDLNSDITGARTDWTSVETIRNDSKVTTQDWYTNADEMRAKAATYITTIKGFAETSNDPAAVYLLAGLTAKAAPKPVAPPATPSIANAVLNGDGSLTINFIGTGPMGTVWEVSRKLAGETSFTIIGSADASTKSYTDNTVPTGADSATYIVKGKRGSISGLPSFPLTAQFGGTEGVALSAAA